MSESVETTVAWLRSGVLTSSQIIRLLAHDSILVRANALEALVTPAREDTAMIDVFAKAAEDPRNREAKLLGTMTVAHVAVACLLRTGLEAARARAGELIERCSEPEHGDLIWYLKSEDLWS